MKSSKIISTNTNVSGNRKIKPIRIKILGTILPVITLAIISLIAISYTISSNMIEKKATNILESSSKNQATQIESWLSKNLATFQAVKEAINSTSFSNEEMQNILNQYYNYNSNFVNGLYISDLSGNVLTAKDANISFNNATTSAWYKEGLTHIHMRYGTPYKNSDGKQVISSTGLIVNGEKPIGILGADLELNRISIIVNSLIDMDDAEAFLVDKNTGMILACRDISYISTVLDSNNSNPLYAKIAEKIGTSNYNTEELENNMVKIQNVNSTNWLLVSYVPNSTIFKELGMLRNYTILIAIISIVVLLILTERVISHTIKPVNELTNKIVMMTNGDFAIDIDVKGNDEISIMSMNLKTFIKQMNAMLTDINEISVKQNKQADESKQISNELHNSSMIQSEYMGNLNIVVDELANSTNEIANTATSLANIVTDVSESGITVDKKMKETVKISEVGKKDIQKVENAMTNVQNSMESLENIVDKVGKASQEINGIVRIIGEFAENTNLLALNASIEAARAGEAGKGFAVVATEIGNLAHNSASSVQSISKLINEINSLISHVVNEASGSSEQIKESSSLINTAVGTFDTIYNTINDTNNLVQGMVKQIGKVSEAASNMAAISEEQAASSEQISATSEDILKHANSITENSQNVADSAENLAYTANSLGIKVTKFKL